MIGSHTADTFSMRSHAALALPDRWIRSQVEATVGEVTRLLEAYNFGEAGRTIYDFV